MNRKEWRTRAADEVNWNLLDVDERFLDVIGQDQQTILDTVHSWAPGAFVPDIETVFLYPDANQTTLSTTLSVVSTDAYVMDLGVITAGLIPTDGTYDGLFHLEAKDTDGKWHRRVCREFFPGITGNTRFTIDRPWRNTTDTGMSFRLFQPHVVLRSDVTTVLDAQLYDATRQLIQALPEGWAHLYDKNDFQGRSKGRPSGMYRSKQFQMEAPNKAPLAELDDGTPVPAPWDGPEPPGLFDYCITYVWGRRSAELVAPGGIFDPTFESSPSPISAEITAPADALSAVVLTLPEIDWQLNFNPAGGVRSAHSGYRIRIYRRRKSVLGTTFHPTIESPNLFQLLAEVDGATTTYTDNGSVIPDYHRRLPESHGYYLWRVVPYQDAEYQLDIRVRRKPLPLYNDSDAPKVDPTANEMLIEGLKSKLYRKKSNFVEADKAWAKFSAMCQEYQAQFASPARIVPGVMRDSSRTSSDWGRTITIAPFTE